MREQSFVARYSFKPPFQSRKTEALTLVDEDAKLRIGRSDMGDAAKLAAIFERLGFKVERVAQEVSSYDLDEGFMKRAYVVKHAAEELIHAALDDGGETVFDAYDGLFSVRTPTRLPRTLHHERRALIEKWLRSEALEWTLSCATEHSDAVCKPINLQEA